jgi:hypothetical protein
MGLYAEPAVRTPTRNARLITLGRGSLLVRWSGEPVWVPVHWIAGSRNGRSAPCLNLGDGCPLHATPPKWHVCTPGLIRVEVREDPAKVRERERAATERILARYRQLPEHDRERLLGEAERTLPAFARQPSNLEMTAAIMLAKRDDAMPPPSLATVTIEPVIVDLPPGAAKLVDHTLGGGPWRGRKCRLHRPNLRETVVDVVDEPVPAELAEPTSVIATLCDMWAYNPDRVSEEIDAEGRTVLRFPLP